jgi:hypothetical protein
MANEISIRASLKVRTANFEYDTGTVTLDQTAVGGPTPGYVTIGTTEESVNFAELGDVGWVFLVNQSSANFVQWGFSTGVYGGRMRAGESAGPFRMEAAGTLYLKADTAACKVLVYGFEA